MTKYAYWWSWSCDLHVCISCNLKDQLLEINIGFYLETFDKLYMLQHHVLWELHSYRGFPYSTLIQLS